MAPRAWRLLAPRPLAVTALACVAVLAVSIGTGIGTVAAGQRGRVGTRLRLRLVVDTSSLPRWADALVTTVEEQGLASVEVVARAQATPRQPRDGVLRRLDRRLYGGTADPQERVETSVARAPADEPDEPRPDVTLLVDTPHDHAEWADGARFGAWWFDTVGSHHHASAAARGSETTETWLVASTPDLAAGTVRRLAVLTSAVDPRSTWRTERGALRQHAPLVVEALRRLRDDPAWPTSREVVTLRPASRTGLPTRARHATRAFVTAPAKRLLKREPVLQWQLAIRPRVAGPVPLESMDGFEIVVPPHGRSWADPFLASHDGKRYVFFEDQDHRTMRGEIACAELAPDGSLGEPATVLATDFHLSYPLVFSAEGSWYMLPEASASGRVSLYRAVAFPDRWELDTVLLDDVRALDTTPFVRDGVTWIFVNLRTPANRDTDLVHLYRADGLTGAWVPHPSNPIVADVRSARPAGRVIDTGETLLRPSQDGAPWYGHRLVLSEITALDEHDYAEREVRRIGPEWCQGSVCTHHYDADDAFEVVDLRRPMRG